MSATAPHEEVLAEVPRRARGVFREEAVARRGEEAAEGEVLRLSPRWVSISYVVLLGILAASILFCAVVTVDQFATGPAVVRLDGRAELTVHVAGTIERIFVAPGQAVQPGDALVRLHAEEEEATLERTKREYEALLVKVLRDPGDQATRHDLAALSAQRRQAEQRLGERTVRASAAGTVSDVRIREGQALAAGERVLTITRADGRCRVVALIPARDRPRVRPGMRLRLELNGFAYEYLDLAIDAIGDEAVGPAEVRRYLGQDLADTVVVDGPVFLVEARTAASTFTSSGRPYPFVDGMPGVANVRVRREPILLALVPGLRWLTGGAK